MRWPVLLVCTLLLPTLPASSQWFNEVYDPPLNITYRDVVDTPSCGGGECAIRLSRDIDLLFPAQARAQSWRDYLPGPEVWSDEGSAEFASSMQTHFAVRLPGLDPFAEDMERYYEDSVIHSGLDWYTTEMWGALVLDGYDYEPGSGWGEWWWEPGIWTSGDSAYVGIRLSEPDTFHYGFMQTVLYDTFAIKIHHIRIALTPGDSVVCRGGMPVSGGVPLTSSVWLNFEGGAIDFSTFRGGFDVPDDETGVAGYRLALIPTDSLSHWTTAAFQSLAPSRYLSFSPVGLDVDTTFPAGWTDVYGQSATLGVTYSPIVLIQADGVTATVDQWVAGAGAQANTIVETANNVVLLDSLDKGDYSDVFIRFNPPADETGISGYRVTARYYNTALSILDTADAAWVPSTGATEYLVRLQDSLTLDDVLRSSAWPFVISVADDVVATENRLAVGDQQPIAYPTREPSITRFDLGAFPFGAGVGVDVMPASDTVGIEAYRLVWSSSTISNENDFFTLSPDRYLDVPASGGLFDFAGLKTKQGNEINAPTDGTRRLYAMALGDSINLVQNPFFLALTALDPFDNLETTAGLPILVDIGDLGVPSTDLEVQFAAAPHDNAVLEYRIHWVPEGESFDASTSAGFQSVIPGSSSYAVSPPTGQMDWNGDTLEPSRDYVVWAESIPDGVDATLGGLSGPSNALSANLYWLETNLVAEDLGNAGNGSDLGFFFAASLDESDVVGYRLFYHLAERTFDPLDGLGLPAGRYIDITPSGSSGYAADFAGILDVDGQPLSAHDDIKTVLLIQSLTSPGIVFRDDTTVALRLLDESSLNLTVLPSDIGDYGDARDIALDLSANPDTVWTDAWNLALGFPGTPSGLPGKAELMALDPDRSVSLPPASAVHNGLGGPMEDWLGTPLAASATYRLVLWMGWTSPDVRPLPLDASVELELEPRTWQPAFTTEPDTIGAFSFGAATSEYYIDHYRVVLQAFSETTPAQADVPGLPAARCVDVTAGGASSYSASIPTLTVEGAVPNASGQYRLNIYAITADEQAGFPRYSNFFKHPTAVSGLDPISSMAGSAWHMPGQGLHWEGPGTALLQLLDASGRTLATRSAQGRLDWRLDGYPAGWYLLVYRTEQGMGRLPFFWQR